MTVKHTATAFVILLALLGYLFFVASPAKEKKKEQEEAEKIFIALSPDQIDSIALTVLDKQTILLEKKEDWKITEPIKTDVNNSTVGKILYSFEHLKKEGSIGKGMLSDFGLNPAKIAVTLKGKKDLNKTILIGNKTPIGKSVYTTIKNSGEIHLVSTSFFDALNVDIKDIRYSGIGKFNPLKLQHITIENKNETIKLDKTSRGWQLTTPITTEGDIGFIEAFLKDLAQLEAYKFISENADSELLKKYGFNNPLMTVELTGADSIVAATFSFTDNHLYLHRKYDNKLIDLELLHFKEEYYNIDTYSLRRKQVMTLSRWAIDSFELNYGTTGIICDKGDGIDWKITSPEGFKAGKDEVLGFLQSIEELKANSFADTKKEINSHNFNTPFLTFSATKGEESQSFVVGNLTKGQYPVKVKGIEQIFIIPAGQIEMLLITPQSLTPDIIETDTPEPGHDGHWH